LTGVDYQGVHIETCPACGGDWLDAGELRSITEARQTRFSEQECLAVAKAAKITHVDLTALDRHLMCPKCGTATHPVNYGYDSGLIIDECAKCGGIWLDCGELEKIQQLVEGWNDQLPDDMAQYGPKLKQIEAQVDRDEQVHISHVRLVNAAINGVFDFFSSRGGRL
jgi:Zn-finger nucleic acid-binding protein